VFKKSHIAMKVDELCMVTLIVLEAVYYLEKHACAKEKEITKNFKVNINNGYEVTKSYQKEPNY